MANEGQVWSSLRDYALADDQTLVQRAIAGEALARRALLERYLPLIYSVCRRKGLAATDAEDATQDTVIKLLRVLPQFRGESKLSTWIYTLAARTAADFRRAPQRREQATDFQQMDEQPLLQALATHTPAYEQSLDADRFTSKLDQLSEPVRTVMLSFYLADASISDIANAMRVPEGTVKTHLFRGRQLLRKHLLLDSSVESAHAM